MFSKRSHWTDAPNRLTALLTRMKSAGKPFIDLTLSNPTECGIHYPMDEILGAFQTPQILHYHPDPKGHPSARAAIVKYYRELGLTVDPESIFLQASTSEGYATAFKVLCDPGDTVLIPRPSYPLFEYLAELNDVHLESYPIRYDGEWHIDLAALEQTINTSARIRAIIIVNPNNPTGTFLKQHELDAINALALRHNLALIVDEVFIDYGFPGSNPISTASAPRPRHCEERSDEAISISTHRVQPGQGSALAPPTRHCGATRSTTEGGAISISSSTVPSNKPTALTFTLNGISKTLGLPQMKLGWIVITGPDDLAGEARARTETVCDTYLSVNTPVQAALPQLMDACRTVRAEIQKRTWNNYSFLCQALQPPSPLTLIASESGWYGLISVPRIKSDEELCLDLLEHHGVSVFPGYYFDIEQDGILVVSLIIEERTFEGGIEKLRKACS